MLLIGSRALAQAHPDARPGRDWDLIARRHEVLAWMAREGGRIASLVPSRPGKDRALLVNGASIEIEDAEASASALQLDGLPGLSLARTPLGPARVVPPAYLAGLKRSHAEWPIHWRKTMEDLHWIRARLGGDERRDPDVARFVGLRRGEQQLRFGSRRTDLAMGNSEFFARSERSVRRRHPHDDLHAAVAYGARPMFERFKRDQSRASLDKGLWLAGSLEHRLRAVREEAMVIALERRLIPSLHRHAEERGGEEEADAASAYAWSVQRLGTTLASGWFRDFVIDHWPQVRAPDVDYVALYRRAFPAYMEAGPRATRR